MKHRVKISLVAGAILLFVVGGYLAYQHLFISGSGHKQRQGAAGNTEKQVVRVKTVPLKMGNISRTILTYGNVIPAPGAQITISVPFESRISHLMVNEGQEVAAGDSLLELGPSPDTSMKFKQAQDAYNVAVQALKNMERKFELRLATNDQLLQAKQTLDQARVTIKSMKSQGIDGKRVLKAKEEGLVSKVSVNEGSLVPAGSTLLQLVPRNRLEMKLGVEPEDVNDVHEGMTVTLSPVTVQGHTVSGKVRKISRSVNRSTRLVDVFVSVPSPSVFLLGQYVSGQMVVGSIQGIVAPRSAVLPEEGKSVLFLVENGRALKKEVKVLAENEREVVVIGNLKAGDMVVTLGNYELSDNMHITGEPSQ